MRSASTEPNLPTIPGRPATTQRSKTQSDAEALPPPVERAEGILTIEAYIIRYNQAGKAESATVIGRLEDGRRALAEIVAGTNDLRNFEEFELVGKKGDVCYDAIAGRNRVTLFPMDKGKN